MEDHSRREPSKKSPILLTLCFAYIPDFSTDVPPYNHKIFDNRKRQHKPSRTFLKNEIERRKPSLKGYKIRSTTYLLQMMGEDEFQLPHVDMQYLRRFISNYKAGCARSIVDADTAASTTPTPVSPRITMDDRLRMIEAFLSDEAKTRLASTQAKLSRQELDARNSEVAENDYFETVSKVFNDETWNPSLTSLPYLHPDLEVARRLPLKEYRTTRGRAKEKYQEMLGILRK
ncbi:hypothetical protein IV203_018911 [Nitzschia inconspicua]|uniref:Uncharacterized protein n=1 Tax=Nitzschia inconspicua TaxID=303405 RepID=A0A9K3M2Z2_9STRA|nr:hypothetical protein IV203_018911 [Nitzschia inconspicua]